MKFKQLFITATVATMLAVGYSTTAQAQASIPIPQITLGGTNINLSIDTNWAAIPFGIYRTDTKQFGYGGAILYQVSPYFWTGARIDHVGNIQTSAGVQANLQTTITYGGFNITPFADASTGMGNSSLYASAGAGALINFHTWTFNISTMQFELTAGVAASYEHVVDGTQNWNQIVGGPLIQLTF